MVIIVAKPYHVMRLSQGYAYNNGHLKNIQLGGMCAICQECTSFVYEMDQINLSMLCSGTRCVAQWEKEEMAVGIPARKMGELIQGLRATVNPMEDNKDKKKIEEKLKECGWQQRLEIHYNENYYRGGCGTLEQQKERGQKAELHREGVKRK